MKRTLTIISLAALAGLVGTRLIVACRLHLRDVEALPSSLQELVPAYLPRVPIDPFDGKPFRYDPERGILYSVGRDLQDGGGSTALPGRMDETDPDLVRWNAKDIVFEIRANTQGSP